MDLSLSIHRVENIGPKEFKKNYFDPQIPLIIQGLTNGTFAGENWSFDYFKRTMGHSVIPVFDNRMANKQSAYTHADLKMKFSEFIEEIQSNHNSSLRIFLLDLFKLNPQLRKEFPCPKIAEGLLMNFGRMFFAGSNTTVRIHYDLDNSNVFHTHFEGKKRVILFSPSHNSVLYKLPYNTYSLINPDIPDYRKYPALHYAKGYDFVIEPGDTLFMPSGYWHYMTYLTPGFSLSYRKLAEPITKALSGLANLSFHLGYDKLMNRIQGRNWLAKKEKWAEINANRVIKSIEKDPLYLTNDD